MSARRNTLLSFTVKRLLSRAEAFDETTVPLGIFSALPTVSLRDIFFFFSLLQGHIAAFRFCRAPFRVRRTTFSCTFAHLLIIIAEP
jgi:hypothetical protein